LLISSGSLSLLPASAGFLLGLLFDLEDEGCVFLQNVGTCLPNYTQCHTSKDRNLKDWKFKIQCNVDNLIGGFQKKIRIF
jgi:hypothetical protein